MSSRPDSSPPWQAWAALLGGALPPLTVYLLTLAPGLTWAHNGADGGDLIVAAFSLGVSHPPGYPAYTLLAHLFSLLPWGSIAFRVNLLSALGASLAAGSLALCVNLLSPQKPGVNRLSAALAAAWLLAFSPFLWSQALIAEVYAPAAALTGFTVWQALRFRQSPSQINGLTLGLLWGISLGFHSTNLFLLPIVAWALLAPGGKKSAFAAGFALAGLQWVYPVARAGKGAFTWGNPVDFSSWWWLVSASLYRDYLFAAPPARWLERGLYLARALTIDFGLFAIPLAGLAARRLKAVSASASAVAAASGLVWCLFSIGYNTADSNDYLLPVFWAFCLLIGLGLSAALDKLNSTFGNYGVWLMLTALAIFFTYSLVTAWPRLSLKEDHQAEQFGQAMLTAAPPGALLLSADDRATFTLWYFQYALNRRPDVLVVDQDLLAFDWYLRALKLEPSQANQLLTEGQLTNRPVCRVFVTPQPGQMDCAQQP